MTAGVTPSQLDEILALQLTVAWAGEAGEAEGSRLGWWKTDLVDPEGGGALFARLAPRTKAWASLSLVRAAAMRIDEAAREKMARADEVWTLYQFGFDIDEQLGDRLAYHRSHEHVPSEVLGKHFLVGQAWSKPSFEAWPQGLGMPKSAPSPAGRHMLVTKPSPVEAALVLAAALAPLAAAYPLPFIEAPR